MRISDWSSDVCSSDLAGRHRFAAARFADDRKPLARRDLKIQSFEQRREARLVGLDAQAGDLEQGFGHPPFLGSSRSRSASPSMLMPSKVATMHRPGAMLSQLALAI